METMTPKERIDAVIKHQAVDRTPFTVVDGGAWIAKTEGVTYRELYSRPDSGASSVVDYLNKIDSDMISAVSGVFTACLNAFGCPISIDKIGGAIDTGSVFKDPINEIPQLNRETIRDTLLANDFVQKMINQTRHVKVLVGNQKYIFGDIAGPFTMAAVMVGTSDFIMLMLEEPEIVHELLDFTVCVSAEMFTLLHENGCDIAFPAEPVGSGSLISQEMFEEWVVPSLKKLKEKLPFYKYFYAHVCGASGNRSERIFGRLSCGLRKGCRGSRRKNGYDGKYQSSRHAPYRYAQRSLQRGMRTDKNCKRAFSHSCPRV